MYWAAEPTLIIQVPIAYIVTTVLAWGIFAFCSLGGYSKIDLHDEPEAVPGQE